MNDIIPIYNSGGSIPVCLDAFKNRACSRLSTDGFVQPTPDEVKALIKLSGWSQTQAAKLTGVSYNMQKGSSTVRKWQTNSQKEHRDISYAAWRLLLIYSGVVDISDDLLKLNNSNIIN